LKLLAVSLIRQSLEKYLLNKLLRKILLVQVLILLSPMSQAATLVQAAEEMFLDNSGAGLACCGWQYRLFGPGYDENESSFPDGPTFNNWSFIENTAGIVTVSFDIDPALAPLRFSGDFIYSYAYEAEHDVTEWGFLRVIAFSAPQRSSLDSLNFINGDTSPYMLELTALNSCLAWCENPYPNLVVAPLPPAVLLFASALLGLGWVRRKA
jgi:hypothetical protein